MKRFIGIVMFILFTAGVVYSAAITDPVAATIPSNMRYQSYVTLSGYTSVTFNFESDLGRPAYLGYIRNVGSQEIELMPNYYEDSGSTMNPIAVGGAGTVWNFSPNNLQVNTLKIRSTTAEELNIEVVVH